MEADSASWSLLFDARVLQQLPDEVIDILRVRSGAQLLDELSRISLDPRYTTFLFTIFEPVFVDIAARWLSSDLRASSVHIIAAFSRVLPLAQYLKPLARLAIQQQNGRLPLFNGGLNVTVEDTSDQLLLSSLLSVFRLLSFDHEEFSLLVSPIQLETLFLHSNRVVRYLTIRCFCLYMHAADAALQKMLKKYCGTESIPGPWETETVDYTFLSLWEEKRWIDLQMQIIDQRRTQDRSLFDTCIRHLPTSRYVTKVGGVLIPNVRQLEVTNPSILVKTPTVSTNLHSIGLALLSSDPLLLVGQAGAGKTSLINHAADMMGQANTMITLHLNEQTDLKSLLGVYSTSTRTGGFAWQPGSLTKAANEGRWVLIEDLDRAPSEVLSVILPLIKNRELVIPSRKERIRCAADFRIIATMRSTVNAKGIEVTPAATMLGNRLWRHVQVKVLPLGEVRQIIEEEFPLITISRYIDTFLSMYSRILETFHGSSAGRGLQRRYVGLRDLIKFCCRIERRLQNLGIATGKEAIPEGIDDEIFLDAVDCFAAYISSKAFHSTVTGVIAEELRMPPQRMQFCLNERIPAYSEDQDGVIVGREFCPRLKTISGQRPGRLGEKRSAFAPTKSSLRTMEQVAGSLQMSEPILLVGETGIGKTAVVQQLASLLDQRLTVVNLSQQSETADLIGGYKPVNLRSLAIPLVDRFHPLFDATFSVRKNQKFLSSVSKSVTNGNWSRLLNILNEAVKMASGLFAKRKVVRDDGEEAGSEQPAKKRRLDISKYDTLKQRWQSFVEELKEFETHVTRGDTKVSFAFVQGKIVKALRDGGWVLLDEINLASPETLESISSLLQHGRDGKPSILLSEAGEVEAVHGHPDFRLFAAMNPATDAGKRDLAPGLRSRFSEFYVQSPDGDFDDLLHLIKTYLGPLAHHDQTAAPALARLYLDIKMLNLENKLTDGAGQKPHFSIRTLVRALFYVIDQGHIYGVRRAVYEGFCMSFLTLLGKESEKHVAPYLDKHLFGKHSNARSVLSQTPKEPNDGLRYVQFKHYWMRQGAFEPIQQPHYIITPFIERNLMNLVRAGSTRRFPILLQGPTSSGKTSMVEYLAKVSGNKFVRINNHEHTDLQEYLGSYVSSEDGSLRYQEGLLVEALRNGYWIVLDELNLAPTDVLEAMNRLLDDNRELFLPETQEVVHPHPNFMLFATQNPAGLYGGRKVLSRAFRNRFLELHFDDIPEDELEFILRERSQIAPSFCTRIVSVYRQLSILRQSSRLFEQRNSFATLRDLFRWAMRRADDREQLANNGFMLLAERVRNPEERLAVKKVIEKVMGVQINEKSLYSAENLKACFNHLSTIPVQGIVWTQAMRRLFILVFNAIEHNEPVLLVGDTGCGKTQLCQAVAEAYGKELFVLNAHVNLETGDLIGAQRPLRNRALIKQELMKDISAVLQDANAMLDTEAPSLKDLTSALTSLAPVQIEGCDKTTLLRIQKNIPRVNALFEWCDGILVSAMKSGQHFLLDELSLADDSVLERLNSVLEPHRSLLLAEKGPVDSHVVAAPGFQFLATMNPGGDYGKRELSAALRNRLTEIWVPQLSEAEDILPILESKLYPSFKSAARPMMEFAKWFKEVYHGSTSASLSVRDLLAWINFVNDCKELDFVSSMVHGACLVYIDSLGANPSAILAVSSGNIENDRRQCLIKLGEIFSFDALSVYSQEIEMQMSGNQLRIGPFGLPITANSRLDPTFALDAPTTLSNTLRIARGLQSSKPILLEGSPGVGKTTLVAALACVLGAPLTRINLSEQTDLTDLFGSDIPVEGAEIGNFAWSDAPFLQALQQGGWVLLDEMNLASQSVLEGLNSCLDHRQQVYIAELDQTFKRHPNFVLFATQNPHHQGGGRKGLPASFVNRFTVVYADSFNARDLNLICKRLSAKVTPGQAEQMVKFVSALNTQLLNNRRFGSLGGPWEINLRDLSRWLTLLERSELCSQPSQFLDVIISQRFRTLEDRNAISELYEEVFGSTPDPKSYFHNLSTDLYQVGLGTLQRSKVVQHASGSQMRMIPNDLPILELLLLCVENRWPSVLVGPSGSGKSSILQKLAVLSGARLVELALNADTDAMDLIGGFEQRDVHRQISTLVDELVNLLQYYITHFYSTEDSRTDASDLLRLYMAVIGGEVSIDRICDTLRSIAGRLKDSRFESLLDRLAQLKGGNNSSPIGFEWTEGLLVNAIERGDWVVLDNANLCNATVLDRLNSLMEPEGSLIINEQRTGDGSIKVVKPHPQFRLFLTMDPRYGELSRAMRNRSVEVFFLPRIQSSLVDPLPVSYIYDSSVYRLRNWSVVEGDKSGKMRELAFDNILAHFSPADLVAVHRSLSAFLKLGTGLKDETTEYMQLAVNRYHSLITNNSLLGWPEGINPDRLDDSNKYVGPQQLIEPIHPLVNEPRLHRYLLSLERQLHLVRLAKLQELQVNATYLYQELNRVGNIARTKRSSEMNRLERSVTSNTISAHRKDLTSKLAGFLDNSCQILVNFIRDTQMRLLDDHAVEATMSILEFCWDLFRFSLQPDFEDAVFLTYIKLAQDIQQKYNTSVYLVKVWFSMLDSFHSTWRLNTGQSMQLMWEKWRPATPSDPVRLQQMSELEHLCSRFDQNILSTRLPMTDLSELRRSLAQAQKSLLLGADGNQLVQDLTKVITDLEKRVRSNVNVVPYFSTEYEALCQYHDLMEDSLLEGQSLFYGVMGMLATRPSKPRDMSLLGSPVPGLLSGISRFSGFLSAANEPLALKGTLTLSLVQKLESLGEVTLSRMDLLNSELEIIPRALACSSTHISKDQFVLLRTQIRALVKEFLTCHEHLIIPESLRMALDSLDYLEKPGRTTDLLKVRTLEIKQSKEATLNQNFCEFAALPISQLLLSCAAAEDGQTRYAQHGTTLLTLAMAMLRCLVPDRPFDPSLTLVVNRKRYQQRKTEKTESLESMKCFEMNYSGQHTSLRIRLAELELSLLGEVPPHPPVFRPKSPQMNNLQGEFMTIITSVLNKSVDDILALDGSRSALIQQNIRQLCSRLADGYRPFADITILVVRLLQLLDLGITLSQQSQIGLTNQERLIWNLHLVTPYMKGALIGPRHSQSLEFAALGRSDTETGLYRLSIIGVCQNTDSETLRNADYRRILRDTLQGLYQHWRDQLSTDQAKEIEKSALFRYRGSLEDNDEAEAEELLEMFPTFDSDSDQKPPSRLDNRDLAPQLFGELKGLFIAQDKVTKLRGIVKEAARLMGRVFSGSEFSTSLVRPKDHLAAVSLLLDDEADGIASLYYDFYADSNLLEVKKLASLVEKIVQRFSAIRESWPEHATLTDIIDCCLEIYEFKHRDPIAKFITKTEKLHGYIYEWQTVASKEYSAVDCYNELTSLLISWRRLELSTWSRLLDIENEKCERAAEGWWFVAYEVIIATPLHLVQNGQDLASHTQDLISTLEKFLTSTPIGQYLFRLQLVEWFTSLLALYSSDFPSLSRLLSALQNLARHYKPYALALKEQLENGRKTLEKDLKQEILLSSWKDTNITALRESARRSHHKLFKIVRKYRALLGQISDALIAGGLPAPVDLKHTFHVSPNELMVVSSATLNACLAIPGWESKPGRFRDPENTIGTMRDVYQSCFTDFDVSQELNAFVRDVVESIDDFKVQTPTTFSEETKEEIQHLKVQKRRFYADKLRDLRHMGFRSNLGTDLLEKQRLSASILATTPVLWSSQEFHRIESAECYFHRFLDLVPKARQAARDYSEDLSNVEVGRSAGFVESILARILNQRKTLSPALTAVDSLTRVIGLMNNVSDVPSNELGIGSIAAGNQTRLQSLLRWLPTLLGLSVTILKSHAKHATIDSSEVLKKLESLKAEIEGAQVAFESLPQLPRGLTSNLHERTVLETQDLVMRARKEVAFIIETRPDLEFALDQILPWTKIDTSDTPLTAEAQYPMSLQDFDTALFSAMDKMFIVLQRVSLVLTACPSATSNASWLVETDNLLSKAMAELRMDKITDSFAALLDKIRYLSGERRGDLGLIIAVLSTMSPILHQYRQICADLIQRFICMHREICKLGYVLTSSFVRVASQGFCNPPEASEEKGESGKLERGTGLGEGEGAEDISKDVQDDEDLSDLAQQKSEHSKEKDETDPAQDAVNMDNEDLEADVEGSEQKDEEEDKDENGSELENEDDLDEEVGSVDGWDESAVDEKLWDGENKPEQKDTENEEGKGNPSTDEQAAAPEKKDADAQETHEKETESDNEGSEAPDAEPEGIGREDIDVTGPQAKEEEILDLPDDMELDEQDKGAESDLDNGMDDDFPDDDMGMEEQKPGEEEEGPDIQAQDQEDDEMGVSGEPQDLQAEIQPENESDAFGEEKEEEIQPAEQVDEQSREADVAQSEAVSAGVDNEQTNEKATSGESAADERSQENTKDNQNTASAAEGGDEGETSGTQAGGEAENAVEDSQVQAFKKLGDILEQWHRSQREIQEASQKEDNNKQDRDINMEEVDFEHLGDEEDTADTQALGQASEEQVKNVDQKKAVESNEKPENNDIFLDADDAEMEETSEALEDLMQLDSAAGQLNQMQIAPLAVSTRDESLSGEMHGDLEATDNIEDVDRHLSAVRLSSDLPPLTSPDEARRLWSHYESVTHDLALSLTEQLRLILAPTMATKLRGDFRTGKRLNIKRIIPYIASQYKRDKIWMRRSVPSKRNYQIMLAVDDSKSMLESASGQLAFETLALIARSLSMLEAGDLCIVSFGNEEHIRVAHEFGKPFSSEAGMQVFQQFSYKQTGTNVKRLVEESIALFRDARAKRSSSSGNADLWQLQLIISDGICEDHDDIRRLLRQAHEERIMIVFIVVDAVKEESGSIMNLTQATFEADESGPGGGKWKMKRYLEGFPFPYYLIVRNVQELPSVLSLALKQWFAEVVELSS